MWWVAMAVAADLCVPVQGAEGACRAACDGGEAAACATLGYLLETGLGVPQSPRSARPTYGEEPLSFDPDMERDLKGATVAYERSCALGNAHGCLSAGVLWRLEGPDQNLPRALERFGQAFRGWEKACNEGSGHECELLGAAWEGNWDHPKDEVRACEHFGRACTLGDGRGCWLDGVCDEGGLGGRTSDLDAAERHYLTSCDTLGAVVGCLALRKWYAPDGRKPDSSLYERYIRRTCELDSVFCRDPEHGWWTEPD